MEKNPWYKNVEGPYLHWQGPVGIKEDGGGCTRGQGKVGNMVIHRATFNKNKEGEWFAKTSKECADKYLIVLVNAPFDCSYYEGG
jgi:hypothetical protein